MSEGGGEVGGSVVSAETGAGVVESGERNVCQSEATAEAVGNFNDTSLGYSAPELAGEQTGDHERRDESEAEQPNQHGDLGVSHNLSDWFEALRQETAEASGDTDAGQSDWGPEDTAPAGDDIGASFDETSQPTTEGIEPSINVDYCKSEKVSGPAEFNSLVDGAGSKENSGSKKNPLGKTASRR